MKVKPVNDTVSSLLLFFFLCSLHLHYSQAQPEPNATGYACSANLSTYPCHTFAFYTASSPNFLDLASIADLFSVSRLMISEPSNISSPSNPLVAGQGLFVPLTCSCNSVNATTIISYANLTYTIKSGDTFYIVSTNYFLNLTTYYSVEIVNPTLVPTNLSIGQNVIFPIFCKCPNETQLRNGVNFLISYVFQPSDNLTGVAASFGSDTASIIDVNGDNIQPFQTIFVPVSRLPNIIQPNVTASVAAPARRVERKGAVIGLAIGLGVCGVLLVLLIGVWVYRDVMVEKKEKIEGDNERPLVGGGKGLKAEEVNLMADVSDCLDKYKVYGIEELRDATGGFSERSLIQGSVYKGSFDGELYAIKKMKWNAYEELKILQKVTHMQ